jgi:hypothetical protein
VNAEQITEYAVRVTWANGAPQLHPCDDLAHAESALKDFKAVGAKAVLLSRTFTPGEWTELER